MGLEEQLDYQGYEHKYKENDVLLLKSIEELNTVNKIVVGDENPDEWSKVNWYLTKEKIELLSNKRLKVLSCISWHMGIPFYSIYNIENESEILYVGEFYLKDEGNS